MNLDNIPEKKGRKPRQNKKWSQQEVKLILDYMQEATDIELPTAQIFYKKLINRTGIDATWEAIKWKVRYLKSTFIKANDWRKSTGAGLMECDAGTSSVEAKILQICPHYEQMNEIFGEKFGSEGNFNAIDSGCMAADEPACLLEFQTVCDASDGYIEFEDITVNEEDEQLTSTPVIPKKAKEFAEKMKKLAPKATSSAAHLAAFQAEKTALFQAKIEWEKEKHSQELAISEKKLQLEEDKIKADIDIRNREIENNYKLKMLEIEKDERIKRYEIEMKYKYKGV